MDVTPLLVILDRDRTLVEGPPSESEYLIDPSRVRLLDGIADRVRAWNASGARVVVATNQRCIALGVATMAQVTAVNARIADVLAAEGAHIDAWYVCPHDIGECECRKPAPGLLLRAMDESGVDPQHSLMLGDSDSDAGAAAAAGVTFERIEAQGRGQVPAPPG